MAKLWYIVHTYSGYEQKVKESLEQRIETLHLEDRIGEVMIPREDVVERKKGKTVITSHKFFPGYILVNMEMDDETWHVIKNTPKVTGFIGTGREPTPLTEEEVEKIVNQVSSAAEEPKPRFSFEEGEKVRIIDGPFNDFSGVVEAVNEDKKLLKIMVTIFGRATPVEVDFLQAEKV